MTTNRISARSPAGETREVARGRRRRAVLATAFNQLLGILVVASVAQAQITPITCTQNTQQSTTSSGENSANCTTASLTNSTDFLVIYAGNHGNNSTSGIPIHRTRFGASGTPSDGTEQAFTASEGRGLSNHWDSGGNAGFARATGDGSDAEKLNMTDGLGNTSYFGAMQVIAVPLNSDFGSEDTDWFYDGTDSATEEVSGVGNTWTDIRSVNFTLPSPTQDWIVLMSVEAHVDGGSATDGAAVRFQVGGTTLGSEYHEEWENNSDFFSFAYAGVVESLASGSTTFRIQGQNRSTASVFDARRSRIWAFRVDQFDQVVETTDTTGDSGFTGTSASDTESFLTTTYTPNQSEYVLVLGNVVGGNSTTQTTTMDLRNSTDTTDLQVAAGEYENDNGYDADRDQKLTLLAATESISSAKQYRIRYYVDGGTGTVGRDPDNTGAVESRLVFWGLTEAVTGNPVLAPVRISE